MAKPRILIAGAGIGGIVAALALLQRGFEVELYEQAAELRELGAGVQISPNGSRVLCELGLQPAMEAIASVPTAKEMRLFNTGAGLARAGSRGHRRNALRLALLAGASWRFPPTFWSTALAERAPGAVHVGARCHRLRTGCGGRDVAAGKRRARARRCVDRRRWRAFAHSRDVVRWRARHLHRLHGLARAWCRWSACPRGFASNTA